MIFRASTAALLLSLSANWSAAQDLSASAEWSGAYFGFTAGAVRPENEAVRDGFTGALITFDVGNGLFPAEQQGNDIAAGGGIGIGYNHQRGSFVAGVELDFTVTGAEASKEFSRIDPNPNPPFAGVITETTYGTEIDNLATLRLRAGVARGRSLFYATGGLAAGNVTNRFSLAMPNLVIPVAVPNGYSNNWSEAGTRFGYVIGVGVEHRLDTRTSLKAEILHFDLEDVTVHAEDPPIFGDNTIDYRFTNDGQVARIGINIRF